MLNADKNSQTSNFKYSYYENLVHDIKIPMTIMYSNLQILEGYKNLSADVKNNIISIKNNWYRVMKLINDINDVNKINNGYFIPKFKNYNIIELIKNIIENTTYFATRKNINVTFNSSTENKIMAMDKYIFERILLNLLSNAIKFNEEGGKIEVVFQDNITDINIRVIDTGIGIDKVDKSKIFNRYNTRDSVSGSGLGLSIVYELVELLNGNIRVNESIKEVGTEFIIKLPVFLVTDIENDNKIYDNFYSDNIVQIELSDDYY